METLRDGVQYGLSSQDTYNKEIIFVKLTESAQLAIETYLLNKDSFNEKPTIQFCGSKGELIFPSEQPNSCNFSFSLSNYQDDKFQCIKQTGPENLESLGILPCKMQIQANDDVYETTKQRLHVAKENDKNKCALMLKHNEPINRTRKSLRKFNSQQSTISKVSNKLSSKFSSFIKSGNHNFNNSHLKVSNAKKLKDAASKVLKNNKKETKNCKLDTNFSLSLPVVEKMDDRIGRVIQKPLTKNNHHYSVSFNDDIKGVINELSCFYYGLQERDYYQDYTTIVNNEQRCRYKDEYMSEFKEYNRLKPIVYKITEHFSHLKEELAKKQTCNDSEGYKILEQQIWIDYSQTKNIKARHHHLHCKLEHIAKLIHKFDSRVNKS